jgi:hypothetical protein
VYCPFSAVDGGKNVYCAANTQHCCETPENDAGLTSTCVATGTACASGDTDWACEDPATDCPSSNPICCADGTWEDGGTTSGMVCENYASKMTHTYCTTQAACTTMIICATQAECTSIGKTACLTMSKAGNQVGVCF